MDSQECLLNVQIKIAFILPLGWYSKRWKRYRTLIGKVLNDTAHFFFGILFRIFFFLLLLPFLLIMNSWFVNHLIVLTSELLIKKNWFIIWSTESSSRENREKAISSYTCHWTVTTKLKCSLLMTVLIVLYWSNSKKLVFPLLFVFSEI